MARRKSDPVLSALESVDKWQGEVYRLYDKLESGVGISRRGGSRTKMTKRIKAAERNLKAAETRLGTAVGKATPKRSYKNFTPTVARTQAKPVIKKPEPKEKPGSRAREFEVGLDYTEALGAKRGSVVMYNWRIARRDGAEMSMSEAQEVVRDIHKGASYDYFPDHEIVGVNWQRPNWGSEAHGDPPDLDSFTNISQTVSLKHFRIGAVKK